MTLSTLTRTRTYPIAENAHSHTTFPRHVEFERKRREEEDEEL